MRWIHAFWLGEHEEVGIWQGSLTANCVDTFRFQAVDIQNLSLINNRMVSARLSLRVWWLVEDFGLHDLFSMNDFVLWLQIVCVWIGDVPELTLFILLRDLLLERLGVLAAADNRLERPSLSHCELGPRLIDLLLIWLSNSTLLIPHNRLPILILHLDPSSLTDDSQQPLPLNPNNLKVPLDFFLFSLEPLN